MKSSSLSSSSLVLDSFFRYFERMGMRMPEQD